MIVRIILLTVLVMIASGAVRAATSGGHAGWWLVAGLFGISAVVLALIKEPAKDEREWMVKTPGMDAPSGPYRTPNLSSLWQKGLLPPGTTIARKGQQEWKDVAVYMSMLDRVPPPSFQVKMGTAIGAVGLFGMFFIDLVTGAIIASVGLLLVIAAKR